MNNVLILLDNLDDWKPYYETSSVLTVSDYLKNKPVEKDRKLVINLSNDYSYNSEGYYCSLLAQTRGQKVIPDVDIINKMEAGTGVRMDRSLQALCYQWIQKNDIKDDIWYLNIYFGKCREKGLERIARFIFENYPCPLLRVALNTHPKNQIEGIHFLSLNQLNDEEQDFLPIRWITLTRKYGVHRSRQRLPAIVWLYWSIHRRNFLPAIKALCTN